MNIVVYALLAYAVTAAISFLLVGIIICINKWVLILESKERREL